MSIELIDMYKGRPSRFSHSTKPKKSILQQSTCRGYSEKIPDTADDQSQSSSFQKIILQASLLMFNKQWQALIQICDRAIQTHEDAELYNMKGRALGKLGHIVQKIQLTKKAIQLNPKCPVYYRNLGAAFYKLQRYELALQSHKKAQELQQENSINYHNIGAVLFRLKRYEQAIVQFKKSLQLNKYQAHSYRWLGNSYKQTGHLQQALQCYYRAFDLSEKQIDQIQILRLEKMLHPWKVFFNSLLFC